MSDDDRDDDRDDNLSPDAGKGPLTWRSCAEKDADALGVLTAALANDPLASQAIFERLDRGALVALCWTIAAWGAHFLEHVSRDPVTMLREIAVANAEREGKA